METTKRKLSLVRIIAFTIGGIIILSIGISISSGGTKQSSTQNSANVSNVLNSATASSAPNESVLEDTPTSSSVETSDQTETLTVENFCPLNSHIEQVFSAEGFKFFEEDMFGKLEYKGVSPDGNIEIYYLWGKPKDERISPSDVEIRARNVESFNPNSSYIQFFNKFIEAIGILNFDANWVSKNTEKLFQSKDNVPSFSIDINGGWIHLAKSRNSIYLDATALGDTPDCPSNLKTHTDQPKPAPEPEQRKIVKGSSAEGIEFYEKVNQLHEQGLVTGELYAEYESDQIVDINVEMKTVMISLKYPIVGSITETDRKIITEDFYTIKALAEEDTDLILSGYGTLRDLVLTYQDIDGKGRGELEQLMIDSEPQWMDW